MRIGIIGAGMIGGTLGPLWLRAGHEVRYGTRHPERVAVAGAHSTTVAEAAAWAEVLLLAVPLGATASVAGAAGAALQGKTVLDAGNVIAAREPEAAQAIAAAGRGSGRWVAQQLPGAHVVKAFNTVYFRQLQQGAGRGSSAPGVPLASDDPTALALAERLVREAGFEPVVVGTLDEARRFDAGTPVWNSGATAPELRQRLGL